MIEIVHGITYTRPQVVLLQEAGIGVSEFAARTCYDSFENSEHAAIKAASEYFSQDKQNTVVDMVVKDALNAIEHSDLLNDLAWTHFHHSILEHANLSYLVRGTSRGVLQEHARHRIQAISVRSTRYTMSDILYAYLASHVCADKEGFITYGGLEWFVSKILALDMFVTTDTSCNEIEARHIWEKLEFQFSNTHDFESLALARDNLELYMSSHTNGLFGHPDKLYSAFKANKTKRNAGDSFKHIVTDNWKVDMVVTFNLRSLKNYLELRDSGAAYFQMRWLAQAIKHATPKKYLDLIIKGDQHDS